MDKARIKSLAYDRMKDKFSPTSHEKAEKYYHGERVASLVVKLRQHLFPEDPSHDDILVVSAWFHDICNGIDDHEAEGARETRAILTPYCSPSELDAICGIIRVHDDRNPEMDYSDQIKLHQDADHLDHFGAFDVWRSFTYAIANEQTIIETLAYMREVRPKDIQAHRDQLNYEVSKRIYDEKMAFLAQFTERFAVECAGGIWGEHELLV